MRIYFNNKFDFKGFSFGMGGLGIILVLIGGILFITLFLPFYPIWYFIVMNHWDEWAEENPSDYLLHFSGVKPRVMDMTKWQWHLVLGIWFFSVISLLILL
jgi:hypothetical protein